MGALHPVNSAGPQYQYLDTEFIQVVVRIRIMKIAERLREKGRGGIAVVVVLRTLVFLSVRILRQSMFLVIANISH